MKGAQTIWDALESALAGDDLKSKGAPVQYVAGIAMDQFRQRCRALGLTEEVTSSLVERGRQSIKDGLTACESPIEKTVLPWLVFENYGSDFMTVPAAVHLPKSQDLMTRGDLVIIPQFAFAKYRMDFAIVARPLDKAMKMVCVECDGQEYHQDIIVDVERDAYLESWGIPTVRAYGKECKEEPWRVSSRAASALWRVMAG